MFTLYTNEENAQLSFKNNFINLNLGCYLLSTVKVKYDNEFHVEISMQLDDDEDFVLNIIYSLVTYRVYIETIADQGKDETRVMELTLRLDKDEVESLEKCINALSNLK